MSSAELSRAALELPMDERLELARQLVESVMVSPSLEGTVSDGIQRIEDVAAGRTNGLTEEQFRAALR
jgi:putative addiction module component (TIGR02574 family)